MTREDYIRIIEYAKSIERLADYLYCTNKLRSDQIKKEAASIIYLVEQEIGPQS